MDIFGNLRSCGSITEADETFFYEKERLQPEEDNTSGLEIHPAIRRVLESMEICKLYNHQTQTIQKSIQGENVILESPTASGKSLAYLIPIFQSLLNDNSGYSLLVFPMKALAYDQFNFIKRFADSLNRDLNLDSGRKILVATYDKDTDQGLKDYIRKKKQPRIILTNPEYLNNSFLGYCDQWELFLKNLKYLVIDEIHEYRGYFGSNMALLLRRFLNKLRHLDSHPRIIMCSATCANAEEHASNLTGKSFAHIKSDSPRPERKFYFVKPNIADYEFIDIYKIRIAKASAMLLKQNLSTLVFCPYRAFVEDITSQTRDIAIREGLDPDSIASYRGGYSATERRQIEAGMRGGKYKIIFATNALELGIDIGRLDVCVLAGFPENPMSFWQRIGRVGRHWRKTGHVIYFSMNNAVDEFYVLNMDVLLNKPLDRLGASYENLELIKRHLGFLLHETKADNNTWGLSNNDREILGDVFFKEAKRQTQLIRPSSRRPRYITLNLRGDSEESNALICRGQEIGTMSGTQKFKEAYLGAVYKHCGISYRVVSHQRGAIELEELNRSDNLRTEPFLFSTIDEEFKNPELGLRYSKGDTKIAIWFGVIKLSDKFSGFKLINENSQEETREDSGETLSREKSVFSLWFDFESCDNDPTREKGGFDVLPNLFRIGFPLIIPSDRHDIGSSCKIGINPKIFIYENISGDIGLVRTSYAVWHEVLKKGIEIALNCECDDGCPRCVYPTRKSDAGEISKRKGLEISEQLLQTHSDPDFVEIFDPSLNGWTELCGPKQGE